MAESKTESKKGVTLMNRGKRHFDLSNGRLSPGEMREVTAEEAERMSIYTDLVDVSKLPVKGASGAAAAAENAKLKAENEELAKQNAAMKEKLAASEEGEEEGKKGRKGR